MKFELEEIKKAYKLFKNYTYYDKNLLYLKEIITEAGIEENNKGMEELKEKVEKLFEKENFKLDYVLLPKKSIYKDNKKQNLYQNITEAEHKELTSKDVNFFIKAPIEIFILSVLWIEKIGYKLDKEFSKNVYGNRLKKDDENEKTSIYKIYFKQYEKFRDNAIEEAIKIHNSKKDCSIINLDISRFFYNVDFDLEKDLEVDEEFKILNITLNKIHKEFRELIKEFIDEKDKFFLPIGLSSSFVIANYVLHKFDKYIEEKLSPIYYGRYVDDMLLVVNKKITNVDELNDYIYCSKKEDLIIYKTKKCLLEEKEYLQLKIKFNKENIFCLNEEKMKFFYFDKNAPVTLLEEYKKQIQKNSSFFKFLMDFDEIEENISSSILKIDGKNTFASINSAELDRLNISKFLASLLNSILVLNDISQIKKGKNLVKVILVNGILDYISFFDRIMLFLFVINDKNLLKEFVEKVNKEIEKIKQDKIGNKLKANLNFHFEYALAMAVSLNKKEFIKMLDEKITKRIDELSNNIIKYNMFYHQFVLIPLLNYTKFEGSINFLSDKIDCKNIKISSSKIKYSPRLIYKYEKNLIFLKSQNGKKFEGLELITIFNNNENKLKIAISNLKVADEKELKKAFNKSEMFLKANLQEIKDIKTICNNAKREKVDLLIFPEISIPFNMISTLAKFSKNNQIAIIGGMKHIKKIIDDKDKYCNYAFVFLPYKKNNFNEVFIDFVPKKYFAPAEKALIENQKEDICESQDENLKIYKWNDKLFSLFNCYEFTFLEQRAKLLCRNDFTIVIEYNPDVNYYDSLVNSTARDIYSYIIQVNNSKYGDSRITIPDKTEQKDLIKVKGGKNSAILVGELDFEKLNTSRKIKNPKKEDRNLKPAPYGCAKKYKEIKEKFKKLEDEIEDKKGKK